MIRLVGGRWNGRKLKTPKGSTTRPTESRTRESLFNILGVAVQGAVFYDLYAGSGAMGLEALSRGAARAVLVEHARGAIACLKENIQILGCRAEADWVQGKLPAWLNSPEFDPPGDAIVFLDPPYDRGLAGATMEVLGALDREWDQAICVAQTERDEDLASAYGPWALERTYSYGDSVLWLYETAAREA